MNSTLYSRWSLWGLLLAGALFLSPALVAQERGLVVLAKEQLGAATVGKQWAVFIAIDRYHHWQRLTNPVRDAEELRAILKDQYFIDEFRDLYNDKASSAGIRRLFADLRQTVKPEDSVFVFYAGHGFTDPTTNTGSWIPVDAGLDPYAQTNWLPHIQIRNMLSNLPAKHVFLVSDACFSGDLLNLSRTAAPEITNAYLRRAYGRLSRQIMTSGASETVPDVSEFARRLKNALRHSTDPCIDPWQLFVQVRDITLTQPLLGSIKESDHQDGGSFIFFRRPLPIPARQTSSPPPQRPEPSVPATMSLVQGGSFMRHDSGSSRLVQVKDFLIGRYEVSEQEFQHILGRNPSTHKRGDKYPVESLSWYDAVEYCNALSLREGLRPAYRNNGTEVVCDFSANGYRLPTEAEWEYAARGGNVAIQTYTYAGANALGDVGWYGENGAMRKHPVGQKRPNMLGLYDMSGNVWEWCWDRYGDYPSGTAALDNPRGPSSGEQRVLRGGAYCYTEKHATIAARNAAHPQDTGEYVGFRVARSGE